MTIRRQIKRYRSKILHRTKNTMSKALISQKRPTDGQLTIKYFFKQIFQKSILAIFSR